MYLVLKFQKNDDYWLPKKTLTIWVDKDLPLS